MASGTRSAGAWRAGSELLAARNAIIPELLHAALTSPIDERGIARSIGPGGIVATGAGSSAAHARFLASVLNESGVAAHFVPLTSFLETPPAAAAHRTLVVFSQGLSPNARLALGGLDRWHSVWLATASGEDVDRAEAPPGNDGDARRRAVDDAVAAGVNLLPYPGAGEYGTLLRIVGPMTAYAAALRFATAASGARRPWNDVPADEICEAVRRASSENNPQTGAFDAADLESNLVLLASGTHTERLENLRRKVLEGMLLPAPPVWDVLDLAHGPFQQMFHERATLIAMARADAAGERELLQRVATMLDADRHRLVALTARLPGPLAILEHEAMMNALVLRYVSEREVDVADWPGKGTDGALYSYDASEQPVETRKARSPGGRSLEDLTWPELEERIEAGARTAIVPLGSIEQHGPHLPFATDAWIAAELARRLASRLPESIVLPVVSFGCASEHLGFPGTLSLESETLAAVLCDLAASVARHGFSRLFVFSAHGGNRDALAAAVPRMRAAAPGLEILAAPGLGASMDLFHRASAAHGIAADASGHHAGEFETSILLGIAPSAVRTRDFAPGVAAGEGDLDELFYPDLRTSAPNGTVGDPCGADGSRAEEYLEAWVESLLGIYRRDESWKNTNGR